MEIEVVHRKSKKGSVRPNKAPRRLSKLKRDLDHIFSIFIRTGANKCYTCDKPGTPKTLQCGHFIPRQYLATRWNEDNCRPQCVGCNIWGKGKIFDFEERLTREIGADRVQALKDKRKEVWKLNRTFYEERIAYYMALLDGEKLSTGKI